MTFSAWLDEYKLPFGTASMHVFKYALSNAHTEELVVVVYIVPNNCNTFVYVYAVLSYLHLVCVH